MELMKKARHHERTLHDIRRSTRTGAGLIETIWSWPLRQIGDFYLAVKPGCFAVQPA
jgi:hypothetical protein